MSTFLLIFQRMLNSVLFTTAWSTIYLEGIPLIVDAGADVDIHVRDKHRPTPLHRAILAEELSMVKELMLHGADPYCLVEGVDSVSGKLVRWDCFELAKVLKNKEVMSFLSKYKVC